tara:strand:- start:492 stop:854 length:363 start_codon:yes stop_codon:yes gene_type:complete
LAGDTNWISQISFCKEVIMTVAKIYQPAKSAMQSGRARTLNWILEFDQEIPKIIDSLMGWCGSDDMNEQVRLEFPNKRDAIAFAEKNNITYRVFDARKRRIRPKSYAENFAYNRKQPWSH